MTPFGDVQIRVLYFCPACGHETVREQAARARPQIGCAQIHPHTHDRPAMVPVIDEEMLDLGWCSWEGARKSLRDHLCAS